MYAPTDGRANGRWDKWLWHRRKSDSMKLRSLSSVPQIRFPAIRACTAKKCAGRIFLRSLRVSCGKVELRNPRRETECKRTSPQRTRALRGSGFAERLRRLHTCSTRHDPSKYALEPAEKYIRYLATVPLCISMRHQQYGLVGATDVRSHVPPFRSGRNI